MVSTSSTVRSPTTSRITDSETSRRVSLGIAHLEKNWKGSLHAVLDDPFDQGGVEVAGDHRGLEFPLVAVGRLGRIGGARGAEAELLLELPPDRHDRNPVHPEGDLEAEAGFNVLHVAPEAQDDAHLFRLHGVEA